MSKEAMTRIEMVLEGVEALARTSVAKATIQFRTEQDQEIAEAAYQQARGELSDALKAFVMPVVRIVEGGLDGQQQVDEKFKCLKCGATKRCELNCADWHATIRSKVETADETFPTCRTCDQPDDPSVLCCERNCPRRKDGEDLA